MQTIEWHEKTRDGAPQWKLTVHELEVALTRFPAVVAGAKPQTWSARLTPEQRAALDAALAHFGAWHMPSPCYVPSGGGTLTLADSARGHVVAFSPGAKEPCSPEGWLRFPAGAASDVVATFGSLRGAVCDLPGKLAGWSPPPCKGRPAGEAVPADRRLVLSYAASVPNVVDSRRRLERLSWFGSGRAVSATVWIDDRSGRRSVAVKGERRIDPKVVAAAIEELRKLRFFADGVITGSRYDGEEVIRCHDRGARHHKLLCYEVEMGGRCGLSAGENAGLDLLRALVRRSEVG